MWNCINKLLQGLTIGGMTGYFLGALFAPKSGAEFRKQLACDSEDLYKQAEDSLGSFKDKTNRAFQDIQSRGEEAFKKASASIYEQKDVIANKLSEMMSKHTSGSDHDTTSGA